jgi:hypothetical protein
MGILPPGGHTVQESLHVAIRRAGQPSAPQPTAACERIEGAGAQMPLLGAAVSQQRLPADLGLKNLGTQSPFALEFRSCQGRLGLLLRTSGRGAERAGQTQQPCAEARAPHCPPAGGSLRRRCGLRTHRRGGSNSSSASGKAGTRSEAIVPRSPNRAAHSSPARPCTQAAEQAAAKASKSPLKQHR